MAFGLLQSRVIQNASATPAFLSGCTGGSLVIAVSTIRNDSNVITAKPSGFFEIVNPGVDNNQGATPNSGRTQAFYRAGVAAQTSLGTFTYSGSQTTVWMLMEWSGWDGNAPLDTDSRNKQGTSAGSIFLPAMSATAGAPALAFGAFSVASNSEGQTAASGYTAVGGSGVDVGSNFGPNLNVVYKTDVSAPSTYTPGSVDGGEPWCAIGAVFAGMGITIGSTVIIV